MWLSARWPSERGERGDEIAVRRHRDMCWAGVVAPVPRGNRVGSTALDRARRRNAGSSQKRQSGGADRNEGGGSGL